MSDQTNEIRNLYGLGKGDISFLDISPNDDSLRVNLRNDSISFETIINYLKKENLSSVILRTPQLIDRQLSKLYKAFSKAFAKNNYPSLYQGVFPVKVNHDANILKYISEFGEKYGHGWEVGTKPELLIAMSLISNQSSKLIICNGAKDVDYLEAALLLTEKGYNVIITIESERELLLLSSLSNQLKIKPQIGLRLKMNQKVEGHWGHSSGLYSKFGVSATDFAKIVELLQSHDLINHVKLLHGHLGSQINKVEYFKRSVTELIGYYQYLFDKGAKGLRSIDLGGGLGIDYEGNSLATESGVAYSFDKYAETIVDSVYSCLQQRPEIIPPDIITESGRAISATSSMMLVEVLERRELLPNSSNANNLIFSNKIIRNFKKLFVEKITKSNSLDELSQLLDLFFLDIEKLQDQIDFWTELDNQKEIELLISIIRDAVNFKTLKLMKKNNLELNHDFINKYKRIFNNLSAYTHDLVCNFSVFRGACDVVLANQYFPVLPTTGLNTMPESLSRLVDITCDSDGEISKYITKSSDISNNIDKYFSNSGNLINFPLKGVNLGGIPLPEKNQAKGSYILIALTGAYQDTVQFDQNLLGGLPEIELAYDELKKNFSLKILKSAESNFRLITEKNHNLDNLTNSLPKEIIDNLLRSNPYVNNKTPQIDYDYIESKKDIIRSRSTNFKQEDKIVQ